MKLRRRSMFSGAAGFTLLPVVLVMTLTGSVAFLLNRDNGVNVNLIGARSDRERARSAAEAGLQAANYAIQANACAGGYPISGSPVTDSNFGGAAYSAYASASTGSPLTLTSTGTYNGAAVTLTRPNVYAYQSGALTNWTTQPGSGSSKDTFVDTPNPNSNYGGFNALYLHKNTWEILIQFDLSPLPAGSRIASPPFNILFGLQPGATVSLYLKPLNIPTNAFLVRLITRSWTEGTKSGGGGADGATWNRYDGSSNWPSPGVGYDSRYLVSVPNPLLGALGGWLSMDVTGAAQRWMALPTSNYGVWLDPNGVATDYYFKSSRDSPGSQRPKLTVSYLLPCGATAPPDA